MTSATIRAPDLCPADSGGVPAGEGRKIGLNEGMTNDAYHASRGVSKSRLDAIAPPKAPIHYWAKHVDPDREPEKKTPALILGDAIHKAVLEPDLVDAHFVTVPEDAPKRPSISQINAKEPSLASQGSINYWRDFEREHAGKVILKDDEMKTVLACRDAVHRSPLARGLLSGGVSEQSYFAIDPETGALIKCRLDYDRLQAEGMVVDLKTTEDASPTGFGRSAESYRYDVQGVWYPDVIHAAYGPGVVENFVFVAVEKSWPHAVGVYYLTPESFEDDRGFRAQYADVDKARANARRDLHAILECERTGLWPGYDGQPQPLRVSYQARRAA